MSSQKAIDEFSKRAEIHVKSFLDLVWYLEFETILWQLKLMEIARNLGLHFNKLVEFEYQGYDLTYRNIQLL